MAEYLSPHHFELYALAEVPSKGDKHFKRKLIKNIDMIYSICSRFFVENTSLPKFPRKSLKISLTFKIGDLTIKSGDSIYFSFNLKGKATASIAPTTKQAQKMKICVAPFAKV